MLAEALRLIRVFHNISQTKLAERLGISNSYLSEIESGKRGTNVSVELLDRYSKIFNIPVSSLLLFSEQIDPSKRSDGIRAAAADKILRILAWLEDQRTIHES